MLPMRTRRPLVAAFVAAFVAVTSVSAQCGTQWLPVGGLGAAVRALVGHDGAPVAAFGNQVARWNGTAWTPMGSPFASVRRALAVLANGDLVVAGGPDIPPPSTPPSGDVWRWTGSAWVPFGPVLYGPVRAMAALPDGTLAVVGGWEFAWVGTPTGGYVRIGDGTVWSPVGTLWSFYPVRCAAVVANGGLVVGGQLQLGGNNLTLARWDGVDWSALGAGTSSVASALLGLANGDLVAGGLFTSAGGVGAAHVARWNGSTWAGLGFGVDDQVTALAQLPDGDLIAGGAFTHAGGASANRIARWDGSSWTAFGAGLDDLPYALGLTADGAMFVGGAFTTAGGVPSAQVAAILSTCPASSSPHGLGCPSSGGSNTLAAATLPWVDATFHADGTGLPSLAIVAVLTSFTSVPQGTLPLASVFAQGVPGCDVLVAPDIVELLVTTTGTAQSTLYLPSTPPLVGLTFFHQMVPIELDALGNFVAITATNALSLTAGVF